MIPRCVRRGSSFNNACRKVRNRHYHFHPGGTALIQRKIKFRPLDAVILVLIIALFAYIYYRVKYGLQYNTDWSIIPQFLFYRDTETGAISASFLVDGFINTLKLSFWAIIFGTMAGIIMGVFRTSKSLLLRMIGRTYVELIRNVPPIVLIYLFYFFFADQLMRLFGVEEFIRGLSDSNKSIMTFLFADEALFTQFLSGIITVAFFEGAYITEIIRSGIDSIERGQREAAYSLGLSMIDQMRFIIMPQAIKRVLPPLANEFINTIKYSALASVISIQELTFMGRSAIESTGKIFEVWITVSLMYLILTMSLSTFVGKLEKKMAASD
jgi:polar amino acid transport system permease protein